MSDKGERSRAGILDAATQLFYEQGFAASSMGEVADAAQVLKGNLSYYFKTKVDLLEAVVEQRVQMLEALFATFVDASADPVVQIGGFIEMIEQSGPDLVRYGCPLGSLATEICKGGEAFQPLASRLLGVCADWLRGRFASRLAATEAAQAAEQLLVMAQGTALLAQAFQDQALVQRQCSAMRDWVAQRLAQPRRKR